MTWLAPHISASTRTSPSGPTDGPVGVDQADVAEGLWEVPDHLAAGHVDLPGEQAGVVDRGAQADRLDGDLACAEPSSPARDHLFYRVRVRAQRVSTGRDSRPRPPSEHW